MRTTSGHLISIEGLIVSKKKTHQPALSVDEQITNLRNIGLIIEDEEYSRSILNDISYFRLIKAYSLGLKPKKWKLLRERNV